MELKDSGSKREFSTGAHRDASEDKGRCDLLPMWEVMAAHSCVDYYPRTPNNNYQTRDAIRYAINAACSAGNQRTNKSDVKDAMTNVAMATAVACGIHESKETNDLENSEYADAEGYFWYGIMQVSKHYEAGANKYGANNWKKGMPLHVYYDSCVRHLMKASAGMTDEPHIRAACWNALCFLWTLNNKSELNDFVENGDNGMNILPAPI